MVTSFFFSPGCGMCLQFVLPRAPYFQTELYLISITFKVLGAHKCIFRPPFAQLLLSAFLSKHFGLFSGRTGFPPWQQRYVECLQSTPCVHPAHHGQHRAYGHQSFDCSLNTVLTGIRCINGSGYWPLPAIACYMSSWLNDIIKEHILYCRYFKGLVHCLSLGHMAG